MSPRPNTNDPPKADAATKPATGTVNENPYILGLAKKTRSLKKKLQRIERTEAVRATGKPINGEQLKLLESKPALEVALAEHDRVRSTIEEVDRDLKEKAIAEAMKAPPAPAVSSTPTGPQTAMTTPASSEEAGVAAGEEPSKVPDIEFGSIEAPKAPPEQTNMEPSEVEAQDGPAKQHDMNSSGFVAEVEPPSKPPHVESVGVATEPHPTEHASVQTDLSGPPPPPGLDPAEVAAAVSTAAAIATQEKEKAVAEAEARGLAAGRAEMTTGLTKIFRLLHATTRYQAKGEPLPSAVDFFSKVLVGKTIPPDEADFDSCVDYSVERASLFLDPFHSSQEVAPGTSFKKLEEMVSSIQEEIMNGPAAREEPVFNFFADTCPAEPSVDGRAIASGASSPNETFVSQPPPPAPTAELGHENARLQAQPPAPITVHGKAGTGHQTQPPPLRQTTECGEEHQAPPPPSLSAQITEREEAGAGHKTPPPKAPEPPRNGLQHAMVLPLPRPQAPPPRAVKTISPSNPALRDAGKRNHESGFLGRQASEMEEGVLPPVVKQEHPSPPPTFVVNGDSALPKRKRRQKPRSRGPPPPPPFSPPFSPGPSGGGGVYMISQPRNPSPPMLHQQQVRPPFMHQHPSPPRTPLQAGQGFGPQAPSPSPPAPGTPQSVPPGGSTNEGYPNGWGYHPHAPQEAQLVQHQRHQHKPYSPSMHPMPIHPAPMHMHREPVAGSPWGRGGVVLSPSNQYPPGVSPTFRAANGPPRHAEGEMPQHLTNGFTLSPDRADTDRDSPVAVEVETKPSPISAGSGPSGQPSGFTPAVQHTPPPQQPPPGAPPSSGLAHGVASRWQGRPRDAEVGPRPSVVDSTRDSLARGSSVSVERALGAESPSERGRGLGYDRKENEDHLPQQQHAQSNGVVSSLAEVVLPAKQTSGAPASIAKSTANGTVMTRTNGEVPAGSSVASGDGAVGKPRAGGKGRGSSSRARAARRVESRTTASKDRKDGDVPPQPKLVTNDEKSQRRSRDQRRGQPLQREEEIQAPIAAHDQAAHMPPAQPEGTVASRYQHGSAENVIPTPLAVPSTVTLQPKASSRTPVSLSWADEVPSPRAQPAQQHQRRRGNGGGRNRQTSQQTSPTSDLAQQKPLNGDISQRKTPNNHIPQQKPPGSKSQRLGHEGHHGAGPSQDGETSQHGRNTQRRRQGLCHAANGSVANNRPREPTRASVNGHNDGSCPEKQGQSRANDGLNNRSLGVASQGSGNRKGRTSSHRRRGGGNGSNGSGDGRVQHSYQHQHQQRAS